MKKVKTLFMAIAAAWAFIAAPVAFAAQTTMHYAQEVAYSAFTVLTDYMAACGLILFDADVQFKRLEDLLTKQTDTFEAFRKANDERLAAIEAKGYAPADVVDKVTKLNDDLTALNKEITEISKKTNRPNIGTDESKLSPEQQEYKSAFSGFIRKGDETTLRDLEKKVFNSSSDVDGGYFIHSEMDSAVDRVAAKVSAVRQLADTRTIGSKGLKFRVKTSGLSGRWVGEGEAGGETANPKFAQIEILAEEIEVEPHVYNDSLEDADFNVEADITEEAGIAFGETEAAAFVSGDGVKKPRGFLNYPTVANASWAWGKVGYIVTGQSGAFASSNPADKVIDLLHSLKSQYRNGAVLLMNDTTLGALRQIKDGTGHFYLFNPDSTGKFGGYVLGVPVVIDDNMPDIAANSYSIAYANFNRAYRIVDRAGISLIRDNLTTKGTTKFNMRKRVGGGIKNFEAIKLLKFGTS